MANAPNTPSYLLVNRDLSLPNSQTLVVGPGLSASSGGAEGNFTISPTVGLASLASLNSAGMLGYNPSTFSLVPRTFSGSTSINILNADGLNGTPTFSVVPNTTQQLITASANGGSSVGNYPELHFTGSGGASCSAVADASNNRIVINYNAPSGDSTGSVTSVGVTSPNSTLIIGGTNPITSAGTFTFDLPAMSSGGTYSSANITVDNYGRVTAASNGPGGTTGTVTNVGVTSSNGTLTVTGSPVTTSGTINVALPATSVTAATYTNSTITVDSFGRITSAANGSSIGTIVGTTNQISANTVSETATLSIPSDFRIPGTLTFPNVSQGINTSQLGYFQTTSLSMQIGWNSSSYVNTNVRFERVGNQVFVFVESVNLTCNVTNSDTLSIVTDIPAAYRPNASSGNYYIGSGMISVYNSSRSFLYNLPFGIVYQSNIFTFVLTKLTTFNGTTYTSSSPKYVNTNIYNFGQNGNSFGLVFSYPFV